MNSYPSHTSLGAGRYAPSPSGDLHLGNLRTALVAWLAARTTHREFMMRVENLDRARDTGSAHQQLEDLQSLGIDWDGNAVFQTDRHDAHQQALDDLVARDLVYECTCSRKDILAAATAPHAPDGAYPGTCRNRSKLQRARARESIAPRLPALRLRSPHPGAEYRFTDRIQGEVAGLVDDVVLQRGDGTIAYNLAVVVDDASAGIDQVVRGADLAANTARQLQIYDLLGYTHPEYAHVPLVLGPNGKRLAKRDGAVTLRQLAARGVDAAHVLHELAESLGMTVTEPGVAGTADARQLLEQFSFARLPKTPWTYIPTA